MLRYPKKKKKKDVLRKKWSTISNIKKKKIKWDNEWEPTIGFGKFDFTGNLVDNNFTWVMGQKFGCLS